MLPPPPFAALLLPLLLLPPQAMVGGLGLGLQPPGGKNLPPVQWKWGWEERVVAVGVRMVGVMMQQRRCPHSPPTALSLGTKVVPPMLLMLPLLSSPPLCGTHSLPLLPLLPLPPPRLFHAPLLHPPLPPLCALA